MPTRTTTWPVGTPCWIDAQVEDPAAAAAFYCELFGWKSGEPDASLGGYRMCTLNGQVVAAVGPKPDGAPMRAAWTTYFSATSVDEAVARAKQAGARFMVDGHDVPGAGRFAIGMDSAGATFGFWEARGHNGIGVYNEPGALCWNELHTGHYENSMRFYADLFGYTYTELGDGTFNYSTFSTNGPDEALGAICKDDQLPDGMPNYWLSWFASADCDATVATATRLGANVVMPATSTPFGRMSVLQAPQGEVFGIIDPAGTQTT